MISAPLARASSTNFFTFGTESAQRLRRSTVQVGTVKSITRSAVSFAMSVTGLSAGGGGNFTWLQSSMTVWAHAGCAANSAAMMTTAIEMDWRSTNSSPWVLHKLKPRRRTALLRRRPRRRLTRCRRGQHGGAQRPLFHDHQRHDADDQENHRHRENVAEGAGQIVERGIRRGRNERRG